MKLTDKPQLWQIIFILTLGVLSVSTAAIFIRLAMISAAISGVGFSLFLAASRLGIAALILTPNWYNISKSSLTLSAFLNAVIAGMCLALHFATWITSLAFTSIAASTSLVATTPIWVALLSWFWLKEKLNKLTIIGIIIAVTGSSIIALGEANLQQNINPLWGNLLALIGAIMASLYLLFGRAAQRQGLGTTNYITIAYSLAALILLPLPLLFGASYRNYPNLVYLCVLAMAIIPQLIGHTSINWSVRWLSPTLVTLAILFEPILSSSLGFIFLQEIPSKLVILGALILLLGVAIAVISVKKEQF